MPNQQKWISRVEHYVETLDQLSEKIDLILDETRMGTLGAKSQEINESTAQLEVALVELEAMVAKRDDLLRATDAPENGTTLTEKLKSTFHIDDARLARRCEEVSEKVKLTHERATALFVCQFHLADLTSDLLKTISGSQTPETYKKDSAGSQHRPTGQGGLFDEAA
ncbi:hypothetical protein LF1_20560 [Rubripirellula obstinata]|uniref:FlgN protein n=1 Tax=Rubripirellula obstinata TaxID=406547 RepID=A0A5B1CH49_9BACT|nr:hypothetical protein [Rubripirellula obstinata]KAA1259522.1 hypothetical protein LF1_20560 [Rubripirellula obstinata]